jgi:predicted nucleic acid-binding protein
MDLTIDTSAVLAVLLNEPTRSRLVELTRGAELRSPGSLPWEVGNACSALISRGRLDISGATSALQSFQRIPIRLVHVELEDAVRVAADHGLYAYNALMIVCARRTGTPLLTLDAALARAADEIGLHVLEV